MEAEIERTGNRMAVMMRRKKSFAQAHHKVAVAEAGGEAESESAYELLCVHCHKKENANLHARLSKKRCRERLTLILNALEERGQAGLTTRALMQMLGRAKNLLLEDLRFLRHKSYIERSKQSDYYLTDLGRQALSKLRGKASR